jgi:site-specific DNA-methyltransferase (adenine-specific)
MVNLVNGDCHEELEKLEEDSIDLTLADVPYCVTSASWDQQPLNWKRVWKELKRVSGPEDPFVFTAAQPFTHKLIRSNFEDFRYTLVWMKAHPSNAINAHRKPMTKHEDIAVFYRKAGAYSPETKKLAEPKVNGRGGETGRYIYNIRESSEQTETGFPTSVIEAGRDNRTDGNSNHPTEKPVKLMAELIKMYSEEGDTILDFTMGSGSTGVAAVEEGRNFIGFEQDEEYFETAKTRIEKAETQKNQIDKFFE